MLENEGTVMNALIEKFLEQYNKQYDFYSEIARIGNTKIESELAKRGIKAIVSGNNRDVYDFMLFVGDWM